jgi:hypothetical protein
LNLSAAGRINRRTRQAASCALELRALSGDAREDIEKQGTISDKAEEFDWVTALSACSVEHVFERLRLQVKNEVETRDEMRAKPGDKHYAFGFVSQGRDFSALVRGHKIHRVVTFNLDMLSQSIKVRDEKNG